MKTKLHLLCILMLLILAAPAQSPQGCGLHIIPTPEIDCLIDDYLERYPNIVEPGASDCLLACRRDTVIYTAVCPGAVHYSWTVTGADTVISSGHTAKVLWGSNEAGHISVTAILSDSSFCTADACILLIEPPAAACASVPAWHYDSTGNKVIEVCLGQTVWLYDRSEAGLVPVTGHYWNSSLGASSSQNLSLTPSVANTAFEVTHCVTNECGCEDCEIVYLRVMDSAVLQLSCHGTVCQNSTASYSLLTPECDSYYWNVEGGHLEGQGTPDITVHWGAPTSGYGVISLDTRTCDSGCVSLRSIRIPVIADSAEIRGPSMVCVGDIQQYELPLWGSTQYLWNTFPDTVSGFLELSAEFPNKYLLEFSRPGTYTIESEYRCSFLQCGPFLTRKTVTVKDTFSVVSPDSVVCIGDTGHYTTRQGEVLAWRVHDRDNTLLFSINTDTLTYTFPCAGSYRVTAHDNAYCREAVFTVTVPDNPPTVSTVHGPDVACLNSSVLLSATPKPGCFLQWIPLCPSATPHSVEGDQVTVNYGNEVCGVAVFQVDGIHGCRSQAYIHNVDTFVLAPWDAPSGIHTCAGAEITLWVADQSNLVTYEWTVQPANVASVQGNHLQYFVRILTNRMLNIPYPVISHITLKRTFCSTQEQYETRLLGLDERVPTPYITHPDTLCEGGCGRFIASGFTTASSHYTWDFGHGYAVAACDTTLCFADAGGHPFSLIYHPEPNCVPDTVTGQVEVSNTPSSLITVSGDTLCVPQQYGVTYSWEFNGQAADECQGSPCCIMQGTGKFCCTVRDTAPPFCENQSCYDNSPAGSGGSTNCLSFDITATQNSCTEFFVEASGLLAETTVVWQTLDHSRHNPLSPHSASFQFTEPGVHTIQGRAEEAGQCYLEYVDVTVDCVPRVSLEYDCAGHLVAIDTSLYRSGVNVPVRTVTVEGTGLTAQISTGESASDEINISALEPGDYTVRMDFDMGGVPCSVSKVFHWMGDPAVTNIDIRRKMCIKTPFQFNASTEGDIVKYRWDFGDNSFNFGDRIFHTYSETLNQSTVIVTLTVTDVWGCTASDTAHVEVGEEIIEGYLMSPNEAVCPGLCKLIQYETEGIAALPDAHYLWLPDASSTTINRSCVYQTGDYTVWVETDEYGCRTSSICNVGFLNAPTARITGNTLYCTGETVALNGNSGASNQYSWSVVPEGRVFTTPNIRFTPSLAGSHTAALTVTSPDNCTATAATPFTVYPEPPAPVIAVVPPHNCSHEPPVSVISQSGQLLHWSNGSHGYGADYYTAGHISALYHDPLTGCHSERAYTYIDPAPDYDALLSGCYRLCPDSLETHLPVYGFYPYHSQSMRWWWNHDGNDIDSGSTLSPLLPLHGLGTYRLRTRYGDNCLTLSPELQIEKTDYCPCQNIEFKPKAAECFVEDCRMYYRIPFSVLNTGTDTLSFNQLEILSGGIIASVTGLPLSLPPGGNGQVEIVAELADFSSPTVELTLIDDERRCETRHSFPLSLNECLKKGCQIENLSFSYLPDESTPFQTTWFQVDFNVFGAADVVALWSNPSQVVDFTLTTPDIGVEGRLMLNYGLLTQLAAEHGKVCLYALICMDADHLCLARHCIRASDLLQEITQD